MLLFELLYLLVSAASRVSGVLLYLLDYFVVSFVSVVLVESVVSAVAFVPSCYSCSSYLSFCILLFLVVSCAIYCILLYLCILYLVVSCIFCILCPVESFFLSGSRSDPEVEVFLTDTCWELCFLLLRGASVELCWFGPSRRPRMQRCCRGHLRPFGWSSRPRETCD